MTRRSRRQGWLAAVGFAMCCFNAIAAGVQTAGTLTRFHQVHRAMGTEFALDLYAADQTSADQIANAAFDEVDRLEELLSNYGLRASFRASVGKPVAGP